MNIDWTINIGDVFTFLAFLTTATAAYFRLDKQIALLHLKLEVVEEDVVEVKADTRLLKTYLFKDPSRRRISWNSEDN